ncbi:ribonuclease BN [Rhodopseudomonas palustris TIE-1]|nr:ribonuclease BN [Rhodopseudomonas palustris TIE-1]
MHPALIDITHQAGCLVATVRRWRWGCIVLRVGRQFFRDGLSTAASSVAFYILLGSVPGLAAVISLYGLFADPHDVGSLSRATAGIVPTDIAKLLGQQIDRLAEQDSSGSHGPSLDYLVWIALLLWSANRGIKGFSDALNIIYNRVEERTWLLRTGVTLLITVGAIGFLVFTLAAVLVLPIVLAALPSENTIATLTGWLRWPIMLVLTTLAIMILLRCGPSRKESHWPSILRGSLIGAALWIVVSLGFAWYAQNIANFSALYGSLGSVIAFMTWLWLSALAVLVGAEFDAAETFCRQEYHVDAEPSRESRR